MAMEFEELDETTRRFMLSEFDAEEAGGNPYRAKGLTAAGRQVFPEQMREAIREGNEETLTAALANPVHWNATETYARSGVERERAVNVGQAAGRLGLTEFNTWYVRGLAKRLMEEGVERCEIYRAATPKWEPAECSAHEGRIVPVGEVYRGHRVGYWPPSGGSLEASLSIPAGPGCHHTIRRVR